MRISFNWLKELLPDLKASAEEVAELLTLHSFETEVAGDLAVNPKVQVRRITKIEPHPNADRLQLATVSDGSEEVTVICGAPNIAEGDVVPFSAPGTVLKDEHGQDFTIKEAEIRGVSSPGMLNSLRELGLSEEHTGIWILPDDTPLGSALTDHFPADTILNAEITPNRAHDCLSHLGIARELAALLELEVVQPALADLPDPQDQAGGVSLGDINIPRYKAVAFDNLTIAPSPLIMQARLLAAGTKPHNQLVDITNYVMFEVGDPTHLFDDQTLPGKTLGVRNANNGEELTALDDEVYQLTPDDLVITIDDKAVAIAGVKGGADTGINDDTTSGLLESANFPAHVIHQTATRLNLHTEASYRFSRGLDPNLVDVSTRRAAQLLLETGATVTGVIEHYPKPRTSPTINYDPNQASKVAGTDISAAQSADILTRLRCQVDDSSIPWQVTVPSDRLDLAGSHDLVEEVLRVAGLDQIPVQAPASSTAPQHLPDRIQWRELTRDLLAQAGFTESYNYSFSNVKTLELMGETADASSSLTVANPISPEQNRLRQSLLPGLFANLLTNKSRLGKKARSPEQAIFEIGQIFSSGPGGIVEGILETEYVAGIAWGNYGTEADARGVAEAILDQFGIPESDISRLGQVGLLDPTTRLAQKLNTPVAFFELNLTELIQSAELDPSYQPTDTKSDVQYQASGKYPPVYRDVSLIVDPSTKLEDIQEVIERVGQDLVEDVDLSDTYNLDADKKSVTYHIRYLAPDRTLTDEEVGELHNKIIQTLKDELNLDLRD